MLARARRHARSWRPFGPPTPSGTPALHTRVGGTACPLAISPVLHHGVERMHALAIIAGALLIVIVLWDAFQTMILSRRVVRRLRPTRAFYLALWTPTRALIERVPPGRRRENFLTVFGPLSLLTLIVVWAFGLI